MNTKTMRPPPRRFLTPTKRKERDGFNNNNFLNKPSITIPPHTTIPSKLPNPTLQPAKSNQLLAGYLAHEFLSKGTLFGQPFDPPAARAEIVAKKDTVISSQKAEPEPEPREDKCERYVEISGWLKREGAHIQGIVNPTQLACFLQM